MWTDDISFCPIEKCRRKTCPRNQMNIRDRTIPHSYFVERPPDCPYLRKDNNHGIYHTRMKGGTEVSLSNYEWTVVHDDGQVERISSDCIEEVVEKLCVNDPQPVAIVRGELKGPF